MSLELYLSFCLASFLMALMPGPDNLYVVAESLSKGARNGLLIALGLNSGVLFHTLAAATGLSLLLKQSELAFQFVSYLGAVYLLFLAYRTAKEKEMVLSENSPTFKKSTFSLFKTGILMNVLNPKVSLFFIAFLPQFVSKEGPSPFYQFGILGTTFMIIGFFTFGSFALLAARLRKALLSPKFWKISKWTKVAVLVILAIGLAISGGKF